LKTIFFILLFIGILIADVNLDTFGIVKFYPTRAGAREWNSVHWNNGKPRTIKYAPDPDDPSGWTEDHSGGTDGFGIDGAGMMEMSGSGPRFHVNSLLSSKVPAQKFRDVEFTAYYRRKGLQGQNYAGMVVGVRSGPLGHGSSGGNDCDALTYYARFRNDGKWDFEKELKHPNSSYWSGSGANRQDPLWNGANLPLNRWIGMKYLCYNIENNAKVKLELYIDSVSNGNPQNGGHWEKVGEVIDEGSWAAADVSGCGYQNTMIILDGGGTMLMRTDNDTADYKMVSIREITIANTRTGTEAPLNFPFCRLIAQGNSVSGATVEFVDPLKQSLRYKIFDFQGKLFRSGTISSIKNRIILPAGSFLFQFDEKGKYRIAKIAAP
jgi:hypothetical protein